MPPVRGRLRLRHLPPAGPLTQVIRHVPDRPVDIRLDFRGVLTRIEIDPLPSFVRPGLGFVLLDVQVPDRPGLSASGRPGVDPIVPPPS